MVEEAMKYVDELSGAEKIALIETLREVTEGKVRQIEHSGKTATDCATLQIFVEVPRARLTRQLSAIREAEGDVAGASALMQDLQVETFGSMDRREKIDFILEQMRLLRLQGEWEKVAIVSKKINLKWLAEESNEDLRIRFYDLLISYGLHTSKYLDLCKYYRAIYESPSVKADEARRSYALRNAVFFVLLAPFDNEQNDLLNRIANDDNLQKLEGLP